MIVCYLYLRQISFLILKLAYQEGYLLLLHDRYDFIYNDLQQKPPRKREVRGLKIGA